MKNDENGTLERENWLSPLPGARLRIPSGNAAGLLEPTGRGGHLDRRKAAGRAHADGGALSTRQPDLLFEDLKQSSMSG